jgi:predicted metal-dependent hydrolase
VGTTNWKLAGLLEQYATARRDPHYLAFFDCFNRQLYFEAHEVLEELWLKTPGKNHSFYKGLIQLAGAFVHVQKRRKGPALALLKLTRDNLEKYPPIYQGLDVTAVLQLVSAWSEKICQCPPGRENELLLKDSPALAVTPGPIQIE